MEVRGEQLEEPGDGTTTGDLLGRAQDGDHEAERRLFSDHLDRMIVRVRRHPRFRLLRGKATEDDIVADVFLRALASGLLDRFDDRGKGSLERSLGSVLHNVIKDALRRSGADKRATSQPVSALSQGGDKHDALHLTFTDESGAGRGADPPGPRAAG